jgi:hypothetical protein
MLSTLKILSLSLKLLQTNLPFLLTQHVPPHASSTSQSYLFFKAVLEGGLPSGRPWQGELSIITNEFRVVQPFFKIN